MKTLFQVAPLHKRTFLQKIFNQNSKGDSVIEINNLLATKPIKSIGTNDISAIASKYKVNVYKSFKKNLFDFYSIYLNHCLDDKSLSEEELGELNHLKGILSLNDKDVENIHDQVAGDVYQKSFQEAIAEGKLDEDEKLFLENLQQQLKLNDSLAEKVSKETRGKLANECLRKIILNERISPEEELEFQALSKNLNVEVQLDERTKTLLERFKLYWIIENGELPTRNIDLNLQKNETCYFSESVDWYEQRTITHRVDYAGTVGRVTIMKGVSFRVGSISAQRITSDEWKLIDSGQIYLTNKRIIFMGSKKNSSIKLDKVLSFTPYSDGIQINKDTGRSPLMKLTKNVDLLGLLLARLLKDS